MEHPRLQRRYSADHIRQQPEFKFITSGERGPYSRISLNVREFEDKRNVSQCNPIKRRASVGQFATCSDNVIHHRPRTAFRADTDGEPEINILHKVDRRFSSVSAITRPSTSKGLSRHVADRASVDGGDEGGITGETNRLTRGSLTLSDVVQVRTTSVGSATDRHPASDCAKPSHSNRSPYDAKLERSTTFLYGKDKSFSKASKYLSAAGPGVKSLHLHYTETNTAQNDTLIFADLLRIANYRNYVVSESVYGLEKRLYTRRSDPSKTTTFYDQRPGAFPFPKDRKRPRTVAQKKKERKEKIKQKNEELKLGYVPTARSLKTPGPEVMEELRQNCRYLRIDPKQQKHLYESDADYSLKSSSKSDVKSHRSKIVFKIPANDDRTGSRVSEQCSSDDECVVTARCDTPDSKHCLSRCHPEKDGPGVDTNDGCDDEEDDDVFTTDKTLD